MEREKPADQRCQHKFENGEQCDRKIDGQGAWQYCSKCRDAAKRQRNEESNARRKEAEDYSERNRFNRLVCYYGLTKPKLMERVKLAESLREEYPSSLDKFHQIILDDLQKIGASLLNPTTDMPSAALVAKVHTSILLYVLNFRRKEAGANIVTEQLIADVMELQRDIGEWKSPAAFAMMRKNAGSVIELRRERGELLNLISALFSRAEVGHLKFLDNPTNKKFIKEERTWVNISKSVCDLAIKHYTGMPKRKALYLNFCVRLIEATLAFNSNEFDQSDNILTSIQEQANVVADAYGTHPVTETVTFRRAMKQAEIYIQRGNIDSATFFLKEAEQAFETMQWRSVNAEIDLAHAKAGLALARNDQQRQDDLADLHSYISICELHPFLTNRNHLQELKRQYRKDVPDAPILKSTSIYMDTMSWHLLPILTNEY